MDENARDQVLIQKGREERIKRIREALQQEISKSFQPPVGPDGKPAPGTRDFKYTAGDIRKELESVLKLDQVKDPEKYKKIYEQIDDLEREVNATYEREKHTKANVEDELERLAKIKAIIDQDLKELRKHFEETNTEIEDIKVWFKNL